MQDQALSSLATPQLLNLGAGSWQDYDYGGRRYSVYTPAHSHVGTAIPLVMMLHGCGYLPVGLADDTRMNELAEMRRLVTGVTP